MYIIINIYLIIEKPCPTLLAPLNGEMECSHDPVMVGSTCSFSCNEEYDLIGSSFRQCLTDTTWNGTDTDCRIKHCPQLSSPPNTLLQSCGTSIYTSCLFSCDTGYYLESGGITYTRSCTITDSVPHWTTPDTCRGIVCVIVKHNINVYYIESTACNPTPCVTGTCHITDSNTAQCVCPDGYTGEQCDTLRVTVSDLPLLNTNIQSPPINITSTPQTTLSITITTIPQSVTVSPSNRITLSYPSTYTNFYLQSSVEGIIRLEFRVREEGETVSTIEDRVTIVSDANAEGTYFRGSSRNTLIEGCCEHNTDLTTRFCTGRPRHSISLSSTCSWTVNSNTQYQSDGIIFLSAGTQSLPVSIIGTNIQVSDEGVVMDFTQPGVSSCPSCPGCNSYPQSFQDIREMIKRQSMINTFLSSVESILPQHISIEAYGTSTRARYSSSDYYSKLLPGHDVQSLLECSNLPIDDTNTDLYYTISTGSDLEFVYDNDQQHYSSSTDRVCFAYPLCTEGSLLVSVPPTLSEQILNLTIFNEVLEEHWEVEIKSITTSRYGLSRDQSVSYWDGNAYSTITQSNHKLITDMSITGGFNERYLQVQFNFKGTITEANDNTMCLPVSIL